MVQIWISKSYFFIKKNTDPAILHIVTTQQPSDLMSYKESSWTARRLQQTITCYSGLCTSAQHKPYLNQETIFISRNPLATDFCNHVHTIWARCFSFLGKSCPVALILHLHFSETWCFKIFFISVTEYVQSCSTI
jgi:hypothetical protein